MSEKLILELYDRVVTLESKVAQLEKAAASEKHESSNMVKETSGRYRYLADYLHNSGEDIVDLTFAEIEKILQSKLPQSARKHRPNWSNTNTISLPRSWMSVGYKTTIVDMDGEKVRFERR